MAPLSCSTNAGGNPAQALVKLASIALQVRQVPAESRERRGEPLAIAASAAQGVLQLLELVSGEAGLVGELLDSGTGLDGVAGELNEPIGRECSREPIAETVDRGLYAFGTTLQTPQDSLGFLDAFL